MRTFSKNKGDKIVSRLQEILRLLQESPNSPVNLAEVLDCPRDMISRHIKELRSEGYDIKTAEGYVLVGPRPDYSSLQTRIEKLEDEIEQINARLLLSQTPAPQQARKLDRSLANHARIIELAEAGVSQSAIARELDIDKSTVSRVIRKGVA